MLTTEPTMVSTFGASKLISFSHMMSFRRPFLDSHLTTYHANVTIQIIAMLVLGTPTLVQSLLRTSRLVFWCAHLIKPRTTQIF